MSQPREAGIVTATWGIILRRFQTYTLVLTVAFVTVLLATTLLASGPMYADAVYLAGAQRSLQDADPADVSLLATTRARGAAYPDVNERVTAALTPLIAGGGAIVRSGESESYGLPDQEAVNRLSVLQFREALDQHTSLTSGRWPEPAQNGDRIEAVLPSAAADLLGLTSGDTLLLTNRLDKTEVSVTVSGIFTINDPTDAYWHAETMAVEGVVEGASFDTYGPFFVPGQTLLAHFTVRPLTLEWQAFPVYDTLAVEDLPHLRTQAQLAGGRANLGRDGGPEVTVTTRIPAVITDIERSLLATRSGVLVLSIQLALLAAYALFLTAGIMVDQRTVETALLRSRGAGVRNMLVLAASEAFVLTAPAVLLGPILAAGLLRLLNRFGPLSGIGLTLRPELGASSWLLALAAGFVCLLTLTIPAAFSARSILNARAARGREGGTSIWRRGSVDVVFLLIAGIGLLQLRSYGAPITETVQGSVDVDPLLVAAPALGLLAGAVIALRLIPWLGRLIEHITTSGQRLTLALGGWQIGRRPLRYSRSALLLTLALGIGLFASAYTSTWQTSQNDQAGYQTGADLRLQPSRRASAIAEMHLTNAHESIPGVMISTPVDMLNVTLSRTLGSGTLVFLDADVANQVVHFRDDLADTSFDSLMETLVSARPSIPAIALPGAPARIGLDMRAVFPHPCPEEEPGPDGPVPPAPLPPGDCVDVSHLPEFHPLRTNFHPFINPALVIRDASGSYHSMRSEALRGNGALHRYEFPLTSASGLQPDYPIELVAIELQAVTPQLGPIVDRMSLHAIATSADPAGDAWVTVDAAVQWVASTSTMASGLGSPATINVRAADGAILAAVFDTGRSYGAGSLPVTHTISPAGLVLPEALPVVVNERLLEQAALQIGDTIMVDFIGGARFLEIVGALGAFPTLDPTQGLVIIADTETLGAMLLAEPGNTLRPARERWLAVSDNHAPDAVVTLSAAPFSSTNVQSRLLRSQSLRADPVSLGMIGALSIGFIAAAVFAIAGFVISVTTTTRERLTEFALLRAIGLSGRQLATSLLFENGVLVVVSLAAGTALGLLLAWLVLPLITVSRTATTVFPVAEVVIPWGAITLLELAIVLALCVASGLIVMSLRRRGLGTALRIGED